MILIISAKNDLHIDPIIRIFIDKNIPFIRLNTEDILTEASMTWQLSEGTSDGVLRLYDHHEVKFSEITTCWYRRPEDPSIHPAIRIKEAQIFAKQETKAFLNGLYAYLSDRFWLNYPHSVRPAESKMANLRLATEFGLRTPRTIITTNPRDAKAFFKICKEDVIVKTLAQGIIPYNNDYYFIYANRLTKKDTARLEQVKYTPTQLQEYIPKDVELRITIVGEKVFACEIHSQDSEKTKIDWRRYDFDNVKHLPHQLPKKIEKALLAMLKKLHLHFGAFDMILTPDGQYVFLELNPNGQFYWIEQLTGMPISKAIADLLIKNSI